ncbi:MAG: pilus assembly protein PilP [Desulfobulbaceae bacterium]|jgi:type IV pilus assembly protein PilP|nr:pilus assembly protein PilP [Deltaproteobacteria bacterium]MDD3618569.1 pilus assembly protein PilP [Desulfobulbaceae bacterium]MDY0352291.1 pilus assembly protein PilP [Desulfobulbaceae bacterium]
MLRKKIPQLFLGLLLINFIVLLWPAPRCHAQGAEQAEGPAPAAPDTGNNDFNYLLEGRPDPFKPFIEPEVATKVDPNEIIEEEVELTGMQLFEPGQLALVAVMFAGEKKIAMVEDVTGKGYVIHEGVLIGRHGVVSEIREDQVIVTETARTRAGNEIVTTVVMRLKKEGDK